MVYRYQPASLGYAPPSFAAPDLDAPGTVVAVHLARPVGYVVWQLPDRLASWGLYPNDRTKEEDALQRNVFGQLRAAAARGDSVATTLGAVLPKLWHSAPEQVDTLETVAALVRPTDLGAQAPSSRTRGRDGSADSPQG